jgi:RNA polymerase sigma-70 factor, ECF subfamily
MEVPLGAALMMYEPGISAQTGLERTFEALHGLVFRTAYRITGNAADAEDVLQTVFLRLASRSSSAERVENEESYLRRAAVNASLDVVRGRQMMPTVPIEDTATNPSCTELREMRDALRRALARLNPKWAEMFALRYFEGYSNAQIAKAMEISQVLVAVTLHRARKQLQNDIRSYMGGRS